MELYTSTGKMFSIYVKITYKCCECDPATGQADWSDEETKTETVRSDTTGADDMWSLKSISNANVVDDILQAQEKLRKSAKTDCESRCKE